MISIIHDACLFKSLQIFISYNFRLRWINNTNFKNLDFNYLLKNILWHLFGYWKIFSRKIIFCVFAWFFEKHFFRYFCVFLFWKKIKFRMGKKKGIIFEKWFFLFKTDKHFLKWTSFHYFSKKNSRNFFLEKILFGNNFLEKLFSKIFYEKNFLELFFFDRNFSWKNF